MKELNKIKKAGFIYLPYNFIYFFSLSSNLYSFLFLYCQLASEAISIIRVNINNTANSFISLDSIKIPINIHTRAINAVNMANKFLSSS